MQKHQQHQHQQHDQHYQQQRHASADHDTASQTSFALQQYALEITPQEQQARTKLRALAIHSWYHCDVPTQRQTNFSKSKIAFPVLSPINHTQLSQAQLHHMTNVNKEQIAKDPTIAQKFSPYFESLPLDRRRDLLFDAVPKIISNDITHNTWSRSIQCLLSQSCDCVFTFISTLCLYHKILQVIMKNRDRVMIVDGKEMVLDSPLSKNTFFVAANILSMKFNDDHYLLNTFFTRHYKMPTSFLNEIEILTYRILSWNLYLSDAVIGQMSAALAECITSEKS